MPDTPITRRSRIDPCPMCEAREIQLRFADRLAVAAKHVTAQRCKIGMTIVNNRSLLELATAIDEYGDLRVTGRAEGL